jgi:hypothetical protein
MSAWSLQAKEREKVEIRKRGRKGEAEPFRRCTCRGDLDPNL